MDDKNIYQIKGFDEEKAIREVGPILDRFYKSYSTKPQELGIREWLFARLKEELPNHEDSYIERISNDIVDSVCTFDEDLKSIDASCEKGYPKEQWLANSLEQSSAGLDVNEYGNYLADINKNLALNNAMAMKAITAKADENTVIFTKNQEQDLEINNQDDKDWNSYSIKVLALNVGKQATLSGVTWLCMGTESNIDLQILKKDDAGAQDFVSKSIKSGIDYGLKVATAGAIKVAVENDILPFLKDTPAGILAGITSGMVENYKTAWKFINGEINGHEVLDRVGRVATAQVKNVFDFCLKKKNCEQIGETIGSVFGPLGNVVGKIVGTVVSNVANTEAGKAIGEGIKQIAKPAVNYAKKYWDGIKKTAGKFLDNSRKSVCNGLKNVGNFLKSLFS